MKKFILQGILVSSILLGNSAFSARELPQDLIDNAGKWTAKSRSSSETLWEKYHFETNTISGKVKVHTNAYVEIGSGLNVKGVDGVFRTAVTDFVITERGAEAHGTSHKFILTPNIATDGAVHVIDPDGVNLKSHPLGLGYYDPVSGQSVVIANITEANGWLVAPNVVVYSNCFDNIRASVLYKNSQSGIAQDLILHERPAPPADYGLSPRSRLEMFTEFLADTPSPTLTQKVLVRESDEAVRATMAEPDLSDSSINFGKIIIGPGKAFSTGEGAPSAAYLVSKKYELINGRKILIEAVEHFRIQEELKNLPQAPLGNATNAALGDIEKEIRLLPKRQLALLGDLKIRMAQTSADPDFSIYAIGPAFVLDYETHQYTYDSDFTFSGATNYLINTFAFFEDLTIEGGTIVKFLTNSTLWVDGPVQCETTNYNPAIFTSSNDDSVGEIINGSTGIPVGYHATEAFSYLDTHQINLSNVRFKYANKAISIATAPSHTHSIKHSQFVNCKNTFLVEKLSVQNVLIDNNENDIFTGLGTGAPLDLTLEHLTVRGGTKLAYDSVATPTVTVKNSLITELSNDSSSNYTLNDSIWLTDATGVFQSQGNGAYYLLGHQYRNYVTSSTLSSGFYDELKEMTTYPPDPLPAVITVDFEIEPINPRDNNGLLDLGYHYPAIDHYTTGTDVQGGTTTIKQGSVIACLYDSNTYGFDISKGKLYSEGRVLSPVRLLKSRVVQEQLGSAPPTSYSIIVDSPFASVWSEGRFRFTEFCSLAGLSKAITVGYYLGHFELKNCHFRNGYIMAEYYGLAGRTIGWTNNLLERTTVLFNLDQPIVSGIRNNTFKEASLDIIHGSLDFVVENNIFDNIEITCDAEISDEYNGFVGLGTTSPFPLHTPMPPNVFLSSLTYQNGLLGDYYLPQNLPPPDDLLDDGSISAGQASLYHFTTDSGQVKEGSSTVDLGYHYVVVDATTGLPIDTDSDGIPDYIEDTDGDGVHDAGETDWDGYDSPNNLGDPGLIVFTPLDE